MDRLFHCLSLGLSKGKRRGKRKKKEDIIAIICVVVRDHPRYGIRGPVGWIDVLIRLSS